MSVNVVPTEDYVLFADKRKSLSGLNKRMLFIMLPLILLIFVLNHSASLFFPWFLTAEWALIYFVSARSYKKQTKPIVVLSSQGIEVDTLGSHLGLIRWNEIEEVRAYNFIYRSVGIVPKSSHALSIRLGGKRAWLLHLNATLISFFYKPLGIFLAPISIPQVYLPVTADELLSHIQVYQEAYQEKSNQLPPGFGIPADEGVWPPPPRSQQ